MDSAIGLSSAIVPCSISWSFNGDRHYHNGDRNLYTYPRHLIMLYPINLPMPAPVVYEAKSIDPRPIVGPPIAPNFCPTPPKPRKFQALFNADQPIARCRWVNGVAECIDTPQGPPRKYDPKVMVLRSRLYLPGTV